MISRCIQTLRIISMVFTRGRNHFIAVHGTLLPTLVHVMTELMMTMDTELMLLVQYLETGLLVVAQLWVLHLKHSCYFTHGNKTDVLVVGFQMTSKISLMSQLKMVAAYTPTLGAVASGQVKALHVMITACITLAQCKSTWVQSLTSNLS